MQKLYKLILTNAGYDIIEFASNGKEAIEKYKDGSNKPDVIIMDHRMPIVNGIDAMIEILHIDESVKIIFASADATIKEKAMNMGAKAFLTKPFNIQDVIRMVIQAIDDNKK